MRRISLEDTDLDVGGHLYEGTDKAAAERLEAQIETRSRRMRAADPAQELGR